MPAWARGWLFGTEVAWLASVLIGVAQIIWIVVQMMILTLFLQPILLAQGLAIIVVSRLPSVWRHCAGR